MRVGETVVRSSLLWSLVDPFSMLSLGSLDRTLPDASGFVAPSVEGHHHEHHPSLQQMYRLCSISAFDGEAGHVFYALFWVALPPPAWCQQESYGSCDSRHLQLALGLWTLSVRSGGMDSSSHRLEILLDEKKENRPALSVAVETAILRVVQSQSGLTKHLDEQLWDQMLGVFPRQGRVVAEEETRV